MLKLRLPRLLALGTFALGLFTTANADDAQAYLVADFDGNGIAIDVGVYSYGEGTIDHKGSYQETAGIVVEGAGMSGTKGAVMQNATNVCDDCGDGAEIQVSVGGLEGCKYISYDYKGISHYLALQMAGDEEGKLTNWDQHRYYVKQSKDWGHALIDVRKMWQKGWGIGVNLEMPLVRMLKFKADYDGSLYIDNVECVDPPTHTISFYYGENLLYSGEFLEGEYPEYPYKWEFETNEYYYEILGWEPRLAVVTADADYVAVLDSTLRTYSIYFEDPYGYGGQSQFLPYGAMPEYTGSTPVRGATEGYTYTFKGWGKKNCEETLVTECWYYDYENGECLKWSESYDYVCTYELTEILPVTESMSYYPMFDSTLRQYTVTFADYDGTILSEHAYDYGTNSSGITVPDDPSRAGGYVFDGWMPYIDDVKGDMTYIANYTAPDGKYTVTFMNGSEVLQTGEYEYGDVPVFNGENPTRESTVSHVYTFAFWGDVDYYDRWTYDADYIDDKYNDGIDEVYKNTVYKPVWAESCKKYMVVYKDDDGTELDSAETCYGDSRPYLDVATKATMSDNYELAGWILEGDPVPEFDWKFDDWKPIIERTVYVAVYKYKVKFVNDDLTDLYYDYLMPGAVPSLPSYVTPYKEPTVDYSYEFVGWDKDFVPVTEPTIYMAMYVPVPVPPSPVLQIAEGEGFVIDDFEDGDVSSNLGTSWLVYSDNGTCLYDYKGYCERYGESTISQQVAEDMEHGKVLHIEYDIDEWAGVGLPLAATGALDLSQCSAIQYDYRGGTHKFRVESPYGVDDQHYHRWVAASDEWTTATLYWSEFENYYMDLSIDVVRSRATQFIWDLDYDGESLEIDNVKCLNKPSYVIRFYDEDGTTLLDSAVFVEGETPMYRGSKDLRQIADNMGDEQTAYVVSWTPELEAAAADVDYTLVFASTARTYRIEFYDGDDWHYYEYEYGTIPEYDGPTPTRTPDDECREWAFEDWYYYDYNEGGEVRGLTPVTDYRIYYARFECVDKVTYTITFLDDEGNVLPKSGEYEAGSWLGSYWPEKAPTDEYEYEFIGWKPGLEMVFGPATYTAMFEPHVRSYPVRFADYDGTTIYVDDEYEIYYEYGTPFSSIERPETPSRDPEGDVEYTFAGWSPSIEEGTVTGALTFVATYTSTAGTYTITFVDGDNNILYTAEYAENEVPVYEGETPTKWPTEQFTYTWDETDGWDKPIVAVTGPAVYTAKFTAQPRSYEVVFINDDGTELYRNTYEYGSTITDAPTETQVTAGKTGEFRYDPDWCGAYEDCEEYDDEYECVKKTYERAWCGGLDAVTRDRVYMANIKYKVNLNNYDDVTVLSEWFAYGTDIADEFYWDIKDNYARFVKAPTVQWDYRWYEQWDVEMVPVTGSVTYKAKLDSSLRKYAVKFVDEDGTVLKEAVEYEYGTLASAIELPDETPTKEPTVAETFAFAGWDVSDVTGSVTYVASFTPSPRMYTVSFVDEDGTPIASAEYAYGTASSAIVQPEAPPKANRRFVGWNPEVSDVDGTAEYVAQYVDDNKFVITWRNDDGALLYEATYSSGETPVYEGATPVKESTDEYSYEFAGWTPAMTEVNQDVEYVATYTGTKREYLVRFVNYDESLLFEGLYEYGTVVADIEVPEKPTKPSTETNVYTFVGWSPELSDVTGEVTYIARFAGRPITSSSSSAVVSSSSAEESSSSEASSSSEEESSSSEEPEISSSSAEESSSSVQMFTVTYACNAVSELGTLLENNCSANLPETRTVAAGTPVVDLVPATDPVIESTPQYAYTFRHWSSPYNGHKLDGWVVDKDITMSAYFTRYTREYTITFVDWDGSEIASDDYEYGTSATDITPSAPTRESDAQYTYTFAGWSPSVARVTGEATYTATYTPVTRTYTVSYGCMYLPSDNIDCPVASVNPVTVEFGTLVSSLIPAGTPTIEPTQEYTFEFIGWHRYVSNTYAAPLTEGETVKGNIKLVAAFDYATNQFKVTFVDWDGSEIFSDYFEYGLDLSDYLPEDPTRENDERNSYTFAGWSPSIGEVTGEATYTATYTATALPSSSSGTVEQSSSSEVPVVSSSSETPVVSSSSETPVASSSSETVVASSSSEAEDDVESSSSKGSESIFPTVAGGVKMIYAHNQITVTVQGSAPVKVQVFDMQGNLQQNYLGSSAGDHVVSLSQLKRGNYVVRVVRGSTVKNMRVMVR